MSLLKNFGLRLGVRLLLLLATSLALATVVSQGKWFFTGLVLGLIFMAIAVDIYWLTRLTNKKLGMFVNGMLYSEFDRHYQSSIRDAGFPELEGAMQKISTQLAGMKADSYRNDALFSKLLESHSSGILVYDEAGEVLLQTQNFCKYLKVSEVSKLSQFEMLLPHFYAKCLNAFDGQESLCEPENFSYQFDKPVRLRWERIGNGDNVVFIVYASQKSSGQNEAGNELNHIQLLHHEIANGLSPIISISDSLLSKTERIEDGKIRDVFRQGLDTLQTQSEDLVLMSENYKKLSRIPAPSKQSFAFKNLIDGTIEPMLQDTGVNLELDSLNNLDLAGLHINGDEILLSQVLRNLLENSLKAMKSIPDKWVKLLVQQDRYNLVIHIIDSGPGIQELERGKVFAPFYTTRSDGHGLGLAISRKILDMHGGWLRLADKQEGGAHFVLRLPLH